MNTCKLVINYDIPKTFQEYINRIRYINCLQIKSYITIISFYCPHNDAHLASALVHTLQQVY